MQPVLQDRKEAGYLLAQKLLVFANEPDVVVLALPRGGVPVAYEIAQALHLPLDIIIVRKLGFPDNEEYAMGAITANDIFYLNPQATAIFNRADKDIQAIIQKEQNELKRRNELYRQNKPLPDLKNKQIILVDDGVATGASIKTAVMALERLGADSITLAIPLLPSEALTELKLLVDNVIYLYTPEPFISISTWYERFPQTTDAEVIELLAH